MKNTTSQVARWVWAKSGRDFLEPNQIDRWLPLDQHLADSASVAEHLWDEWVSPNIKSRINGSTGNDAQSRSLLVFLAGIHDVGKATPAFAIQVPELAEQMRYHGLPMKSHYDDRARLPHSLAGHIILRRFLTKHGWTSISKKDALGCIIGGHHGVTPERTQLAYAAQYAQHLFGNESVWSEVQTFLVATALERSGLDLEALMSRTVAQPVQVLLTGLVIMADWIASNEALFPLEHRGRLPIQDPSRPTTAWRRLSLPRPWQAQDEILSLDDLLTSRFSSQESSQRWSARPIQVAAVELARTCDAPGLVIIEAPMGEGKTEAALLAAEILAARTGASGCLVALPTQATTNAMFRRVLSWLERVSDSEVSYDAQQTGSKVRHAISLSHGKAHLEPYFRSLEVTNASAQAATHTDLVDMGIDEISSSASSTHGSTSTFIHHWMQDRKKSPLAEFVVSTIDQVLFTALQARHVALRHLGLAGKVVVIDEIHSYDAYMSHYLTRALEWLGSYGVPVVMLSATLPAAIRCELVQAYQDGLAYTQDNNPPASEVSFMTDWSQFDSDTSSEGQEPSDSEDPVIYPAITTHKNGIQQTTAVAAAPRKQRVDLQLFNDDLESLTALLETELQHGGCALVVRNTVDRAQNAYNALRSKFGPDDVTLSHSRFLAVDRAASDMQLLNDFGPQSIVGDGRPKRRIVVATQVVEQSLDLDFDLLVTDLAPIDIVLQRIGRLHRHTGRKRAPNLRSARCVITGVEDWEESPPKAIRGSIRIYSDYHLLQSVALLSERATSGTGISLPDDIAPLVAAAYRDGGCTPEVWQATVDAALFIVERDRRKSEHRAESYRLRPPKQSGSLVDWLAWNLGEADETVTGRAQVRDSAESIEVLVLIRDLAGDLCLPSWVSVNNESFGELLPEYYTPDSDVAQAIAQCSVRISPWQIGGQEQVDRFITHCESQTPEAWQNIRELHGQIVLELDMNPDDLEAAHRVIGDRKYTYSRSTGLKVTKWTVDDPKTSSRRRA